MEKLMCNHPDCKNEANHAVIFEFRAEKNGVAAQSTPVLVVCQDHTDVKFDEVFDQRAFDNMCEYFESRLKKKRPVKEFCNIAIFEIDRLPGDVKKIWDGLVSGTLKKKEQTFFVCHIVKELDESMMQKCTRCGAIITDYRNTMQPEGSGPVKGFPAGEVYELKGQPTQYIAGNYFPKDEKFISCEQLN